MGGYAGTPNPSGGSLPFTLDEIPQPKEQQNIVPGAEAPPVTPQPPGAGWMGNTGQVADIATGFLHGMLRGKLLAQQKLLNNAQNDVQGSKAAFDVANGALNNLVQSGVAQDDPRVQQAKLAASTGWQNYVGTMAKYTQPPAGTKQSVGSKVKGAVTPQAPQLYSELAINALKSYDPTTAVVQSAQSRQANAQATESEQKVKDFTQAHHMRDDYNKLSDQYNSYLQSKDPNDQQKAKDLYGVLVNQQEMMKGYGVNVGTPLAPREAATKIQKIGLEETLNGIKKKGMDKLQGGGSVSDLTPAEQSALGMYPKDALEVYLGGVGKQYKTSIEAVEAMMRDQGAMYAKMYSGMRQPTATVEIMSQIKAAHPDWNTQQVAQEFLQRVKPDAAEKKDVPLPAQEVIRARGDLFRDVVGQNPETSRFFTQDMGVDQRGNKQTAYTFNPGVSPETHFWGDDETKEDFDKSRAAAITKARELGKQRGFNDSQLDQMGLVQSQPAATATTTNTQQKPVVMNPVPSAAAGSGQPTAPPSAKSGAGKNYRITDPKTGQSQTRFISDDKLSAAQALVKQNGGTMVPVTQ